jgi:hypothetical protein
MLITQKKIATKQLLMALKHTKNKIVKVSKGSRANDTGAAATENKLRNINMHSMANKNSSRPPPLILTTRCKNYNKNNDIILT